MRYGFKFIKTPLKMGIPAKSANDVNQRLINRFRRVKMQTVLGYNMSYSKIPL